MEITTNKNKINLKSVYYSGYEYVHIIQKVTTLDIIFENSEITSEESTYELSNDGYYIISEIRLPDSQVNNGYYILNGVIYNPNNQEITPEELLEVEPEGTNIVREDFNYFLYYYLETYYHNLIKDRFNKNICNCNCSSNDTNKVIIDTLTMGLEIIKSLIGYLQFYEAQRLIEQLSVCSGIDNLNCNCNG